MPMSPPPNELLADIAWAFDETPFADAEAFQRAVQAYQIKITDRDSWQPDVVALDRRRLRVRFFGVDPDDPIEYKDFEIELKTDRAGGFTAGELLWGLHQAVAPKLIDADHRYFEGLVLEDGNGDAPLYEMRQGS